MGFWMKKSVFQDILLKIKNNELEIDEALNLLSINGYIDMGHTKFDIERESRTGFPEVVFCETKGKDEFFDIVKHLIKEKHFSLLTRLKSDQFEVLKTSFKDKKNINLYEKARMPPAVHGAFWLFHYTNPDLRPGFVNSPRHNLPDFSM